MGDMITVKAAGARLSVSPRTIYSLIKMGRLTKHRLNFSGKGKRPSTRLDAAEVDRLKTTLAAPASSSDVATMAPPKQQTPRRRTPELAALSRRRTLRKVIEFE